MLSCPLFCRPDPAAFYCGLNQLDTLFDIYSSTSSAPLPAAGLMITPEIRCQSEFYLPVKKIARIFNRFYQHSLAFTPVLSSSPFSNALSWADCFVAFPAWLQFSANPARLLDRLLADEQLFRRFIFYSFAPARFNGTGFGRYPAQLELIREFLSGASGCLRILDAACGSGEGTWELAELASEAGFKPEQVLLEGCTLDPLEVWSAEHRCLPDNPQREQLYRNRVQHLLEQGWGTTVHFKVVNLLDNGYKSELFDLILCNGLLGGAIINQPEQMRQIIASLAGVLVPGGMLLIADRFHGGWKKKAPTHAIAKLLKECGLKPRLIIGTSDIVSYKI